MLLRGSIRLFFLLMTPGVLAIDAAAQIGTMREWENEVLLMIRHRSGSSMTFDRGLQHRYTPWMDHEYDLDMRASAFSPEEDAAFYDARIGFRTRTASINKSRFATATDIRLRRTFGERHRFSFHGRQQEDLKAQRFFVDGEYAFRISAQHAVGLRQTMGSYKPDLDSELFYEATHGSIGSFRAGVILLDAFNNAIFDGLGVDPALEDTLRSYDRMPRMLRIRWLSPSFGRLSFETYTGLQPPTRATITTHSNPLYVLDVEERFGYGLVGVFLDLNRATLSLSVASWRERRRFDAPADSPAYRDYAVEQRETTYGMRLRARLLETRRGNLMAVGQGALLRYSDRQSGTNFSGSTIDGAFHLTEDRLELEAKLLWEPHATGPRAVLRWLSDHRRYNEGLQIFERDYLQFAQWSPNSRLSIVIGYDHQPWFRLEAGASIDIDGDRFYTDGRGVTRFDGGFGRIQVLW